MTHATSTAPADHARASELGPVARFLHATELDTRMLGMVGALLIIWAGLQVVSSVRLGVNPFEFDSRTFLSFRNLWNLSVQTSSVAIMATGMVLVIVMRNIDLSVGSVEGLIGMIMGFAQVHFLIRVVGLELGNPWIWVIALAIGVATGLLIGALQGFVIAYLGVPAFIVTLGGLLIWRGAAWWVTSGQTIAPLDATFQLMGGGPRGSIGATWSWVVGLVACLAVVLMLLHGRVQRRRFRFPAAAGLGRDIPRRGHLRRYPCRRLDRELLSVARRHRAAVCGGERHHRPGRRAVHRARHRHTGADGRGGGHRHDVHQHAHALRPLRVRHRAATRKRRNSPASTPAG